MEMMIASEVNMQRQFKKWRNVALFCSGAIGVAVMVVLIVTAYDWVSAQDLLVRK